jgi:tRNA1(Val) A37 N6-methylase TrmN6
MPNSKNFFRCIGIDINPVAVSLSQKNISFALPPSLLANSEFKYHRPTIIQGDARNLFNILTNESINHVLSHPPYKDCVEYSNNIDGDLSKFSTNMDFCKEMQNVVNETWR